MRATPSSLAGRRPPSRRRQTGVATLLIVMALFFLVSMVAAYSSRNLVFEQRTSANQYRATQAFEVAEGGVDWALALLNSGRVDASCAGSFDPAQPSFRSRYLGIDAARGTVTPSTVAVACQRNSAGWSCSCPSAGEPAPVDPGGTGVRPAFRVKLQPALSSNNTPALFAIDSTGCTTFNARCLQFGRSDGGEAAARVNVTVAIVPALGSLPAAALTVRGNVQPAAPVATLVNEDANSGALTVHAGGTPGDPSSVDTTNLSLFSVAGNPDQASVVRDTALATLSGEAMFTRFLGMSPQAFRRQPAVVRFAADSAPPCRKASDSDPIAACIAAHPGRPVWVEGNLSIDGPLQLGSADTPLLLVVDGKVSFASAGVQVVGLVYSRAALLDDVGRASIRGALIAEGSVSGTALPDVRYDGAVLSRIRLTQGSVVRLPGGWKDF